MCRWAACTHQDLGVEEAFEHEAPEPDEAVGHRGVRIPAGGEGDQQAQA